MESTDCTLIQYQLGCGYLQQKSEGQDWGSDEGPYRDCFDMYKYIMYPLWRAIELGSKLSCNRVQLEGDAQVLINAINEDEDYLSWFENLEEDAKGPYRVDN